MKLVLASIAVLLCVSVMRPQSEGDWERAITGQDHTVEVDALSLNLQPDGAFSARFRTSYSRAEPLVNDPKVKYKTRVETIEFKSWGSDYRSMSVSLLDSDGKVIADRREPTAWKPSGASAHKWYQAITTVHPFGEWKVMGFRLLELTDRSVSDTPEFDRLVGSNIYLQLDSVTVGRRRCPRPGYQSKKWTAEDLSKALGTSIEKLGLAPSPVHVVALSCSSTSDWPAGQSLIVTVHRSRILMLWDGVFLELAPGGVKRILPIGSYDTGTKTLNIRSQ